MIKKQLIISLIILEQRALLGRIPQDHPKRQMIEEERKKYEAGYRGQKSVKYFLDLLPDDEYYIFHDLRLQNNSKYFQMDAVLLITAAILILEVKNFSGHLYFDKSHQVIRTLNDRRTCFSNPIAQVKLQAQQLNNWLKNNKLPVLPIESVVIFSNSSAIIEADDSYE
ncbi:Nuclease-related domain-containing protein [Evansella caseinilytica]|uniref:Nuclease-related domain-containing protein n=1 Tax=Evansella caseinilytica TaxID=1503961 RepID=A0A1H3RFB4_9BACI|nr:nuclease-related domain-containing protein [Evansella caseinilytica]SDZ24414.1 Nuclease-related domain-containing protein [Evansella caseinilytica]